MWSQIVVSASGTAAADRVWDLLSCPASWPAWAPHMRHVSHRDGHQSPGRVHVGQRLHVASLVPGLGVHVEVTDVQPGRSWTMQAQLPFGAVEARHTVAAEQATTEATVDLRWVGPRLVGVALLTAYRPVAAFAVRRLLALAESEAEGAATNAARMCGHPADPR